MSIRLSRRVRRHLDAAYARGEFDVGGLLVGLDAAEIADGIAAEWQGADVRPDWGFKGSNKTPDVELIGKWVELWMRRCL